MGRNGFNSAIIGCGRICHAYIEAIKECEGVNLVAVVDVRKEAADAAAEMTGCRSYTELDPLIKENKLDGAIVCAPPKFHKEIACQLMNAGIAVLCEKPLALTLEEGQEMFTAAEKNEVVLMMASKFRYVEDIIRAKSIISSGMLGNIHFYENRFCSNINMAGRWNINPTISGGGVLIDNGPHSVDIARYLMGPIKKIFAHESTRSGEHSVEDTVTISFVTEKNLMGTVYLSWAIPLQNKTYIDIYGTEGQLKVGWGGSTYQHNGHPDWISFGVGYNKVHAFKNQVENFVDAVRGISEPLIGPKGALASIKLITCAYQSLQEGKWVTIDE